LSSSSRVSPDRLDEQRDLLTAIVNSLPDPIVIINAAGRIVTQNQRADHLLASGDSDSEERRRAVEINNRMFRSHLSKAALAGGASATSGARELKMLDPGEGTDLLFEVLTHELAAAQGTHAGSTVSVLHDLTEPVENERRYEELKKFSSELEERSHEAAADLEDQNTRLQWQSRELENANRLKSEFLASMSHELRTPINALIGYTALLLDRIYGDLTPRQEDGLKRVQASAQHLLALINDILDLAKIEAGRMPLHIEAVPLREIIIEVTQQIEPLINNKAGLSFSVEQPEEAVILQTDRTKVKQILLNLLSNAVKFTYVGGVWLGAHILGDHIRFDVRDTGIGIKETDLEAIWEDFRQVDQSRTREFGGTGLGLCITRKLVHALGGKVSAESEYGTGSTFTVTLPVRSRPRVEHTPPGVPQIAADVDS
jgi:signal transduction histidine kinase